MAHGDNPEMCPNMHNDRIFIRRQGSWRVFKCRDCGCRLKIEDLK